MDQPTGHDAIVFFENQPEMQPGTLGFWRVWGSTARDIRAGDILLSKSALEEDADDPVGVDYVAEVLEPSMARVRFVDQHGKVLSVGMLAKAMVVRWGTHGTLSEHAR